MYLDMEEVPLYPCPHQSISSAFWLQNNGEGNPNVWIFPVIQTFIKSKPFVENTYVTIVLSKKGLDFIFTF